MKTRSLLLVILSLSLVPLSASAWDTRLQGLGSPSLAIGQELPSALSAIGLFPTDQFNVGISVIADPVDIFTLPQQLGNDKLFPGNALVAEWTSTTTGSGGLVMKPKGSAMTFAIFLLRPGNNSFAVGGPRGAFGIPGGTTFAASSTLGAGITNPTTPSNIFDFFFSYKLGNILLGVSGGFAYSLAAGQTTNIVGTPSSDTTDSSSSWAATGRAGASLPLGPVAFDAGVIVVAANETATRVSGTAAAIPNLNNKLSATNIALAADVRASLPLADTLDLAAVGNFSMLPQNFSASNAAGTIDTTTAYIDPSGLWSAGAGTGITWKASDAFVINGYLGAIVGAGNWVNIAPGTTPRPTNSTLWVTLKPLLSGEVKPASWLTIRGGISYVGIYNTTTINVNAPGTASTTATWFTGTSVNAGCSIQLTDKALLEMVVALANFTGAGAIAAPFVSTSLKMDL